MKKILAFVLAVLMLLSLTACDNKSKDYETAMGLYNEGQYEQARELFVELADYEDSAEMVKKCDYQKAEKLYNAGDYTQARQIYEELGNYEDCAKKVTDCNYRIGMELFEAGKYDEAAAILKPLGQYKDAVDRVAEIPYKKIIAYVEEKGGKITKYPESGITSTVMVVDGELCIGSVIKWDIDDLLELEAIYGACLRPNGKNTVYASAESVSYASYEKSDASSQWSVATYTKDTVIYWDNFNASGYTANGGSWTRDTSTLGLFTKSGVHYMVDTLMQVLEDSGLGLTMADLGFISYK